MTLPTSHGYPDYGRTFARSNVLYHDVTDGDIDGQETLSRKFCGDRGYLHLSFVSITNHFEISFRYFADVGGTQFVTAQTFSVRQGGELQIADPVKGASFEVLVTPSAINSSYSLQVWGADVPSHMGSAVDDGNILLDLDGVNVNAGATRTDTINTVWPGPASFFADSTAASFTVYVEAINRTGGIRVIARHSQTINKEHHQIYLPRSTVRVRSTNNDAAAKLFWVFISAHPHGIYG